MKDHIDLLKALARRMEAYFNGERDDLWGRNEAGYLAKCIREDIVELERHGYSSTRKQRNLDDL